MGCLRLGVPSLSLEAFSALGRPAEASGGGQPEDSSSLANNSVTVGELNEARAMSLLFKILEVLRPAPDFDQCGPKKFHKDRSA